MGRFHLNEKVTILEQETIIAQVSASGRSGVNVLRLSGIKSISIALKITKLASILPRHVTYTKFHTADGKQCIDYGLVIYFVAPHSFTGEDVVELHCHGGAVISDWLIETCLLLEARLATAGEFSYRAYLNNKLDLTQAEAVADLIDSSSRNNTLAALRTLEGEFSTKINQVIADLTQLRVHIEADLDFADENVDILADNKIRQQLVAIEKQLDDIINQAHQGSILQEGVDVVIAGSPNAGKSSLLNYLAKHDKAIVTSIAGTTRDVLHVTIHLGKLKVHLADTAGLQETNDPIEKEGIKRSWQTIQNADIVLLLADASLVPDITLTSLWKQWQSKQDLISKTLVVYNKIDLLSEIFTPKKGIQCSIKTSCGMQELALRIQEKAGINNESDSTFLARRRHLVALNAAKKNIQQAFFQTSTNMMTELIAADLAQAQDNLGKITGKVSSDDLLGKIFSSFCIGK